MRAPYQILAIPYQIADGKPVFCVLHRADCDQWQFVAGGGEDRETPEEAAIREISEEAGIFSAKVFRLASMCYIPAGVISEDRRIGWPANTFVIPEYAFAFPCDSDPVLSHEHDRFLWLDYESARKLLQWDSNRTALYELHQHILNK